MFEYYTVLAEFSNFLYFRNNNTTNNFTTKQPVKDYFTIFISLIVIILSAIFIWIVYKRYLRDIQEDNEQETNNTSSEEDKAHIEMQYLEGKAFAFIPLNSPIKVNNGGKCETPKDEFSSEKTNDSSIEMKVKTHAKMKSDNISSFNHNINNQNIEDVIKI